MARLGFGCPYWFRFRFQFSFRFRFQFPCWCWFEYGFRFRFYRRFRLRLPLQFRLWEEKDPDSQEVIAIRQFLGTYAQSRTIWTVTEPILAASAREAPS